MRFNRPIFMTLFVGVVAMIGACSRASEPISVNTDESGNALRGYDTVAYFAVSNAVKGDPKYAYIWNGATWLFSSEENMKKFQADPEAYAPQFGGYCSYAVSEGYTANGDPEAWKVVDGRLYLNYSPKVKEMWEKNEAERIENGNNNWKQFKTKKPEHKG